MKETDFHAAPEWLTKHYLETVLRNYKQDPTLKINNLDIQPATAKGDNYASVMTRIKINFSLKNDTINQGGSYIVKTSFENDGFVSNIMNDYDVCRTEMLMYEQVLPQMSKMLREIGDKSKIFADTIHVDIERSAIIFEDLAVKNFVIADRLSGMDLAHAKMTLTKLAKMHATAAVLNERKSGLLEKFDHGIFNRHTRAFSTFFENIFEVCADFAGNCAELGPYYREKLLKLKCRVMEYGARCYDHHENSFNTLNHGDLWVNNIMVRYDDNTATNVQKLCDLILIDFQFSCWASPAVDLHYFFNTSLKTDMRLQQMDALIQFYYQELTQTLQNLKFESYIPTLHEFHVQLEEKRFFAVIVTIACQALLINDKTEDADFNALMKNDERGRKFRNILYTNKMLQDSVQTLLPIFDRRGLLDVVD